MNKEEKNNYLKKILKIGVLFFILLFVFFVLTIFLVKIGVIVIKI